MLGCSHCEHSEVPSGSDLDPLENLEKYYWKEFFFKLFLQLKLTRYLWVIMHCGTCYSMIIRPYF